MRGAMRGFFISRRQAIGPCAEGSGYYRLTIGHTCRIKSDNGASYVESQIVASEYACVVLCTEYACVKCDRISTDVERKR